tara:strand:- start:680 stop:997 length:318 start_codon:yes stop_codon:yes gene_type:complete
MHIREILTDERGRLSAARVLLTSSMLFIAVLIILDSTVWDVPQPAYVLLGSWGMGLLTWAAGPRVAQYLGPQVSGVGKAIAQAVKQPRRPSVLDNNLKFREDDEV